MIIISKERNEAYNMGHAERIYIGIDKPVIKIVIEATALVLSGKLDKIEQKENYEPKTEKEII